MHTASDTGPKLFGVVAEYSTQEDIVAAAKKIKEEGWEKVEAYTPYSIEGLVDILKNRDDRVPWLVFIGGMLGAALGFSLCYYITVIDLPLNVGGRPDFSWPSYIPITFEAGILTASFFGVLGMLALNGLPRPHHPMFDAKNFDQCSQNKFFLCIEAEEPGFDKEVAKKALQATSPDEVSEVISE